METETPNGITEPRLHTSKLNKEVEFKLSVADKATLLDKITEKKKELGTLEIEFAVIREDFKKRLAALEGEFAAFLKLARDGHEVRVVECEMERDFEHATVRYWHEGTMVEERAMTAEERQTEIDFAPPPSNIVDMFTPEQDPFEATDAQIHDVIREETSRSGARDLSTT